MFIVNILTIMELVLSIKYTYSFKSFKHAQFTYYKAQDSVFLTNPKNHNASYGIYVVGKTINVDIPKSVVKLSTIVNWKVVNLDKDRLMFVHNAKPQILINQMTIKQMKFPRDLTGSIIPFGDSEALHVPTIFNPTLTQPLYKWNYIELLYFNVNRDSVTVIRRLPWLKDDDWKFIIEWKMTDYIHFDDKLYLLIQRSIFNEQASNVTQEISIIRLCLDKGSELISTAVEIHYVRPEFQTNKITAAIFICSPYYLPQRIILLITQQTFNQSIIHKRYFIDDFVSLFDKTAQECASAADNYTRMRYYLRSEARRCQKTTYKSCSPNVNTVPSVQLDFNHVLDHYFFFLNDFPEVSNSGFQFFVPLVTTGFCQMHRVYTSVYCEKIKTLSNYNSTTQDVEAYIHGYPHDQLYLHYNNVFKNESRWCVQHDDPLLTCYITHRSKPAGDLQLHFYLNHRPFGYFQLTATGDNFFFYPRDDCFDLKSCIHCMMYGLSIGCIWSNAECKKDEQNVTQTLNYCFGITQIFPLMFNSSSPETLTIELDRPLEITASHEHLVINAGPNNHCTNIKINGSFINCSMHLAESGQFKIDVSLRNFRYADSASLRALSSKKVNIIASEVDNDNLLSIIILVLWSLANLVAIIVCSRYKKKRLKRFEKFSGSKKKRRSVNMQVTITRANSTELSSRMNNIRNKTSIKPIRPWQRRSVDTLRPHKRTNSAVLSSRINNIRNKSSIKLVRSWHTVTPSSRRSYSTKHTTYRN